MDEPTSSPPEQEPGAEEDPARRLAALESRVAELEMENWELAKSEIRLANVLEIAQMASWELDLDSGVSEWSPEIRYMLGVGPDAPALPETVLAVTEPEDRHIVMNALNRAVSGESRYDITYRINRPDGQRIMHSRGDVLRDEDGHPRRVVGIVQDVTEREALRSQLLQSQKMETIGRLSAALAHDLNNMLTVIVAACEFVAQGADDAQVLEDLDIIRDASHRAGDLVSSLLAFSRQTLLRPRPVDVNELLVQLRRMLRRLLGETIQIEVVTTPVDTAIVDPQHLMQVLINLAVNARDAMPRGGTLTLRTEQRPLPAEFRADPGAEFILVRVEDTGQGMDRDTLAQVFEPFFTTKAPHEGTGLGLSTALGVIEQSGGHIRASSVVGEGSAFEICLPITDASPAPAHDRDRSSVLPLGNGAVVLIVEDDAAVRRMAVRALEYCGYRVVQAAAGDQALVQHADAESIDLLLTDAIMPGLSGRELADAFLAKKPELAVLFMSGYTGDPRLETFGPRGDDAFLPKPFTPDELCRAVGRALTNAK